MNLSLYIVVHDWIYHKIVNWPLKMSNRANTIALKMPSFFPSFKCNLGQRAFSSSLCSDSALYGRLKVQTSVGRFSILIELMVPVLTLIYFIIYWGKFFWCGFVWAWFFEILKFCNFWIWKSCSNSRNFKRNLKIRSGYICMCYTLSKVENCIDIDIYNKLKLGII